MKLKELRAKTKLNQTEFAKIFGLTQGTYSNYENETTQPDIELLKKIADYFHITVDNLIDHEVPYMLDKSTLTKKQKRLIDLICQLDDYLCEKVEAYIEAKLDSQEDIRNKAFYQFKQES